MSIHLCISVPLNTYFLQTIQVNLPSCVYCRKRTLIFYKTLHEFYVCRQFCHTKNKNPLKKTEKLPQIHYLNIPDITCHFTTLEGRIFCFRNFNNFMCSDDVFSRILLSFKNLKGIQKLQFVKSLRLELRSVFA